MKTESISKHEARQFLVNYHNLNGSQGYRGLDGVIKYFKKVRSIQFDPLNVVGRNADLVLQSKVTDYKPEMLQKLLYKEHILVDGFDKEMCIYLTEDYLSFERIRTASGIAAKYTLAYRNQLDALEILDEVRDFIMKNGPISTKHISIGQNKEGRWGPKKLSSAALDYLYTIGELYVADKKGTIKLYDFTKNILPSQLNDVPLFHDEDDFLCWYIKRRIASVGIIWDRNGGAWQGHFLSDKVTRGRILSRLSEEGVILPLYVDDLKVPFYIQKQDAYLFENSDSDSKVKFLAPLDNLLWDREMVSKLFDFDYRWEVYTPTDKRKFGYYVLPVLYGNKLIARFEPEKLLKNRQFSIKNWWWEPDVKITNDLLNAIDLSIHDFCSFLEAEYSLDYLKVIMNIS